MLDLATDCEIRLKSTSCNLFRWTANGKQRWYLMFLRLSAFIIINNIAVTFTHTQLLSLNVDSDSNYANKHKWQDVSLKTSPPDDGDMRPSPTHSVISLYCRWLIRKTLLYKCCQTYKSCVSFAETKSFATVWTHAHSDKPLFKTN